MKQLKLNLPCKTKYQVNADKYLPRIKAVIERKLKIVR